jgi:mannose-6-phosphate isomerase-like protein (cupin superfamily)
MAIEEGEQTPRSFVVQPGDGRVIRIPGVPEEATVKAAGADTAGTISFHEEWHGADDTGVPRHFHRTLDELFYVLEGEMRFLVGEEIHVARPGTFVYIARGTIHAWRPVGTGPVRQLLIVVPGGFEGYFDEMNTLPPPATAPEAWQKLNQKWDVEVVGPILESE